MARVLNLMLAATPGGLESMALHYHQALAARGVEVLSVGLAGSWFERALARQPHAFAALKPASPIDPRQGWRLRRVARAFAPDVVIAHGSRGAAVAIPALAGKGAPVAVVMHNFRARPIVARAALVIAVSEAVGVDLRARLPAATVAVVENFAPLFTAPPREGFSDPPLIGTLGRLHAEKGFDVLIRAAGLLRDRGRAFRLIIAGEGEAAADLRALARTLALADRVDFPGWVAPPGPLLASFDLYACPSRTEAFGLVVVEAMAAGTPVIATDIEGPRDLLAHGRYGRLVPPEDPEALADALEAALDDPAGALAMAKLAQTEAVTPYTLETGGERLWAALQPLVRVA